ncbi:O-antigen ligase family protein [Sporosarcina sp. G11-34]|uniref:O-antigen ligase family protein n=1 Tax=Sporosarcina sp. G11-34 TaxID=2849605 RepID=UPI0022A91A62|nr:O-antigen ligase family protein [Sporosarcina sp. G11-34]
MELKQHKIMLAIAVFIILQPLIDVLTTASILYVDLPVTIGVLIRLAYLAIMAAWIVYAALTSKKAKLYLAYLTGFALLIVINFATNYFVKDPFLMVEELTFYTKVVYFHVLFFGFLLLLEKLAERGTDTKSQLVNYFLISALFISAVFIVSQVTGTSLTNYARSKEGWTGWFYAGNEIGAIMAILLPLTALFAVTRTFKVKDITQWIPFVLLSISMLALGTKVGYGGIVIVLLAVLVGSLIIWVLKLRTEKIENVRSNFFVSFILLIVLAGVTPFTPVFGNMFAHLDILGLNFEKPPVQVDEFGEVIEDTEEEKKPQITGEQMENLIFSSREQYVKNYEIQFKEAPAVQQLFGMGYAGNYDLPERHKPLKMIEMDFHDWFYSFGLIGFLYMMAPIVYFAGLHILRFVRRIPKTFDYFHILTGVSILLGIGISYTAGHVLVAPAVSIYMAFLLAALIVIGRAEDQR